jgi:hypothetical protein
MMSFPVTHYQNKPKIKKDKLEPDDQPDESERVDKEPKKNARVNVTGGLYVVVNVDVNVN